MSLQKIIELNRDSFCLKASVDGSGPVAIVIGSHKYYPRTFSENLKSKLINKKLVLLYYFNNLICIMYKLLTFVGLWRQSKQIKIEKLKLWITQTNALFCISIRSVLHFFF